LTDSLRDLVRAAWNRLLAWALLIEWWLHGPPQAPAQVVGAVVLVEIYSAVDQLVRRWAR
jgi:hypothetical protein